MDGFTGSLSNAAHYDKFVSKGGNTMRRLISICGVATVTVAILLVTISKSYTSTAENQGAQIVGSWYGFFDFEPITGVPGTGIPGLFTMYRDGTTSAIPAQMFGLFPNGPETTSPDAGTWVNTGQGTYTGTYLCMRSDRVTGALIGFARARTTMRFGDDFDHLRGVLYYEKVDCPTPITCPDPMDPQIVWTPDNPPGGLQMTAERIRVLPVGPLP